MANEINTVPLGEAGTGAAYILPQSQAIGQTSDYIDQIRKDRATDVLLRQKQAEQLAKDWQSNQLKIKGGTLFQPEINSRAAKVMQMGIDLQGAGINPNSIPADPKSQQLLQQYQNEKALLLRDVDTRDEINKQALVNEKLLASQPDGYFDSKSVQDYHDYVSGKTPLSEISAKGMQMPELKKTFNLQLLLDKISGVPIETTSVSKAGIRRKMILPNEDAHNQIATSVINNNPEVQADIAKKAGVPFNQIGNQTDAGELKKQLDDYYRSYPQVLAQMGISSYSDPAYDSMITGRAKAMANAAKVKQDYAANIKNTLDNKVHRADDKTYDFEYEDQQMQRQRLSMERERFSDWKKKQQEGEEGSFSLGNNGMLVPVIKQLTRNGRAAVDESGKDISGGTDLEEGAALFNTKLPNISVTVQPGTITSFDNKNGGRTRKNVEPIQMKVSGIKMVPVWTGLPQNDPRNGSELSAKQLANPAYIKNIEYKPIVFGIHNTKDSKGHVVEKPIAIPYDDFKGTDTKKVKTDQFDKAIDGYYSLLNNPQYLYKVDPSTGEVLMDEKTKKPIRATPDEKLKRLKLYYGN